MRDEAAVWKALVDLEIRLDRLESPPPRPPPSTPQAVALVVLTGLLGNNGIQILQGILA